MFYVPNRYKKILTLMGGVLIQLTLGYYYTFGNLNPYLTSYLRELISDQVRYSNSIWINSTMAIAQSISSALGGVLVLKLRLSLKLTTFIGCVIMSSGIALTFFAIKTSFALTLLTHGLLNGLGMGFAYVPPMSLTMRWFPDHKGMAMALLLCGYGCGGIIFTQLQTLYINPDNLVPDEQDPKFASEYYFSKQKAMSLLDKVPSLFLVMGAVIFTLQLIGMLALFDPSQAQDETPRSITVNINDDIDNSVETDNQTADQKTADDINSIEINEIKTKNSRKGDKDSDVNSLGVVYGKPDTGMSLSEVVRTKAFYMIWFMYAFTSIVPGVLSAYYKTFGEPFITNDKFLTLVGSLASVCNASGRIFWGFLIEKFPFKINILLINTVLIVFTSTLYLTKFIDIPVVFLLWICSIYFTFCGIYVIMPIITARCFGQKNFTLIYGLVFTTGIFANLGTSSLASLIDPIGWFGLFMVLCGFAVISSVIAVFFDVKKSNMDDI